MAAPGRPAYPWRGRITCHPAPGLSGSPDGTGAQRRRSRNGSIANGVFAGSCCTMRDLAKEAGGVSGFILGSELVGLTRVRSASGVYPAVESSRISQATCATSSAAAPISSMRRTGPNTARMCATAATRCAFRSIRSSPMRLSTRSASIIIRRSPIGATGPDHADLAVARSVHDVDYLRDRLGSGEAFDWYYANAVRSRSAQTRTPITDGAAGKPWVFRQKDLVSWWSNAHVERVGGVEIRTTALARPFEADLADRDRHSGGGQGHQRTQRLSRSEILGIRLSAVLARRARRSHAGARAGGDPVAVRSGPARVSTGLQSGLAGLWPAHGRSRQHVRVGMGRAAVSGLPGFHLRLGGWRQLGDRSLDHGPHRGRCARPADRRDPEGFRHSPIPARSRSTASRTATWSTARCRRAARSNP